jgi:pyrroline-5-carboxylate reductase
MKKIGIFGYGNMGRAIYKILKKEKKFDFFICSLDLPRFEGVEIVASLDALCQKSDLVFLCVKPQEFYQLEEIIKYDKPIIVSIMAGIPISAIKKIFPKNKIIRTMPNLNMQIGKAVIGAYLEKKKFRVDESEVLENLFNKFGKSVFVNQEKDLNKITAISGSGPAFVFLFYKSLVEAAQNLGFNEAQSKEIVSETISGSLDYLKVSGLDADELIKKVASKKGTTEAAFKKLNIKVYKNKWKSAAEAALKRADELSKINRRK